MPGGVWRTADAAAMAALPRGFLAAEPLGGPARVGAGGEADLYGPRRWDRRPYGGEL